MQEHGRPHRSSIEMGDADRVWCEAEQRGLDALLDEGREPTDVDYPHNGPGCRWCGAPVGHRA